VLEASAGKHKFSGHHSHLLPVLDKKPFSGKNKNPISMFLAAPDKN
jgi:hypothetical protein